MTNLVNRAEKKIWRSWWKVFSRWVQ